MINDIILIVCLLSLVVNAMQVFLIREINEVNFKSWVNAQEAIKSLGDLILKLDEANFELLLKIKNEDKKND
jgi:hypothetical protein